MAGRTPPGRLSRVVTSLSGTPITTIGDGAWGLALSANDETLYAATGDTVSAFNTTTLKETASYPTPGLAGQVAVQSGERPRKPGECVRLQVQQAVGGGWVYFVVAT